MKRITDEEWAQIKDTQKAAKLGRIALGAMQHPNYEELIPLEGESLVSFTLRCAAHLVSPPQYDGESYEVECTDIAASILSIGPEVEEKWNKYKQ